MKSEGQEVALISNRIELMDQSEIPLIAFTTSSASDNTRILLKPHSFTFESDGRMTLVSASLGEETFGPSIEPTLKILPLSQIVKPKQHFSSNFQKEASIKTKAIYLNELKSGIDNFPKGFID